MKKKSTKKVQYTIGLDLGGTKLAGALVRSDGKIIDFTKVPVDMKREGSPAKTQKRVLNLMADICLDFRQRYPKECSLAHFAGVGLASAGPLNAATGTLIHPVNFPGWKIVPIRDLLDKQLKSVGFKTNVHFQNDAIAAALAEGWCGGARGLLSYAVVTVGTGIGSGVIFQGQPCHTKGMGSEFGHTIADYKGLMNKPEQLSHHTVEGIASGTALLRRAKDMGFKGSSVEELVAAYEQGQHQYKILFQEMAWALAVLCYDLSIGFRLERILLSGGLIKIKKLYLEELKSNYKTLVRQFNPSFIAPIQIAKTKNQAGVLGAAWLPYLYS